MLLTSAVYSKSNTETQTKVSKEPLITDYFVRVVTSSSSEPETLGCIEANHFTSELKHWFRQKTQEAIDLADVVKWQHSLLEYNAHYNALLLEQITDDEFEEIASQFVYDPQYADPNDIVRVVNTVLQFTHIEYSPSDIADLFKCEQDTVLSAIKILSREYPNLMNMLPEQD